MIDFSWLPPGFRFELQTFEEPTAYRRDDRLPPEKVLFMFSNNTLYTSQSATSCYEECPRRRYFQYHYDGIGIVSTQRSIPLTTGSCLHTGVQYIAERFLVTGEASEDILEQAIELAKSEYRELVEDHLMGKTPDEHQAYTKLEQEALTEVLIRLWWLKEFPKIREHYHILAVEQEIASNVFSCTGYDQGSDYDAMPDSKIIYQCKPDLILIHKGTDELVNYSLKSVKSIWGFAEEAYHIANQVFTEPYFTQKWLQEIRVRLDVIAEHLACLPRSTFAGRKFDAIQKFITTTRNQLPAYVSSIRFCFLIKGTREESPKGSKKYYTNNPFLYGWRKFTPSEIQYAWTQWTSNPQNKSGYGKLDRGWEEFPTFLNASNPTSSASYVGERDNLGIKAWIYALWNNTIPNDIGDGKGNVFDRYILSQPDIQVNPKIMNAKVTELIDKEKAVQRGLRDLNITGEDIKERKAGILNLHFPMVNGACYYPQACDYLTICPNGNKNYREEMANDPLNVDFGPVYERRKLHHETEAGARASQRLTREQSEGAEQ